MTGTSGVEQKTMSTASYSAADENAPPLSTVPDIRAHAEADPIGMVSSPRDGRTTGLAYRSAVLSFKSSHLEPYPALHNTQMQCERATCLCLLSLVKIGRRFLKADILCPLGSGIRELQTPSSNPSHSTGLGSATTFISAPRAGARRPSTNAFPW